eukprot:TRINITY_DN13854_c0_g1_i1.p1 TRINITY_DN13854_c0_g1~~TRINITY_DN13854_c0_g1_i1.p1  ORF type:complete len:559 (+),score=80.14 TRINITY_DN13854_c0_g1_i1:333-2009(+)
MYIFSASYSTWVCSFVSLLLLFSLANAQNFDQAFDIIVYGSTPSGLAAAISISMFSPKVTVGLLYPGEVFGGMSVDGYIGLRDINIEGPLNNTIAHKWAMINAKFYNVSYPVYQLDQAVAKQSFYTLLSRYPNIKLFPNTTLTETNSVVKKGTTITSIQCTTDQGVVRTFRAGVFVDASYEADLVRFSNTSYTYGRESVKQYNESLAGVRPYTQTGNFLENNPVLATITNSTDVLIPFVENDDLNPVGSADKRMMGYSFRLCLTTNVSNQHAWDDIKPVNYNSDDFIMFQRYLDTLVVSANSSSGPDITSLYLISPYRNYPPANKFDLCDSQGSAFTSDAINLNQGYVDGSYEKRGQIANNIEYYVLGGLYFLATSEKIPSYTQKTLKSFGVCKDQPILPPQLYVREGARLVGDSVFTQNDIIPGKKLGNSIGLGSWWYDIHVVSRVAVKNETTGDLFVNNEGQVFEGSGEAYEIPITILLPKISETTNLLVTSCPSTSHVSFASIRVEPTFMQIGESAGIVASLAILKSIPVQGVKPLDVQTVLNQRGIAFHWPATL